MIEFNHPEKGWVPAHLESTLTWADCQWINDLTERNLYRLKED
jgi:hypothetical protein